MRANLCLSELSIKPENLVGKKILDVGCGQGEFVHEFESLGADAYGLDPNQNKILYAQRHNHHSHTCKFVVAVSECIPFCDNTFDFVIMIETLEHVQNPQSALKETIRILKPHGKLYVRCPNFFLFSRTIAFGRPHSMFFVFPIFAKFFSRKSKHRAQNYVDSSEIKKVLTSLRVKNYRNLTEERLVEWIQNPNTHLRVVNRFTLIPRRFFKFFSLAKASPILYKAIRFFPLYETIRIVVEK